MAAVLAEEALGVGAEAEGCELLAAAVESETGSVTCPAAGVGEFIFAAALLPA